MSKAQNEIDQYISRFPDEVQVKLQAIRETIKKAAPEAEEVISYGMPGYKLHGALVYFAGNKHHIGFYPVPFGIKAFEKELGPYKSAKATAQFPYNKPIPFDLVTKIVQFRMKENLEKAATKKKPQNGFLSALSAPARRALEANGVTRLQQLTKFSEQEILNFHGIGPSSIPKLRKALQGAGLDFRKN